MNLLNNEILVEMKMKIEKYCISQHIKILFYIQVTETDYYSFTAAILLSLYYLFLWTPWWEKCCLETIDNRPEECNKVIKLKVEYDDNKEEKEVNFVASKCCENGIFICSL